MNIRTRIVTLSLVASGLAMSLLPQISYSAEATKATPEAVYKRYHQAMVNAKVYTDVTPYLTKATVKEMTATPAEERKMMFGMLVELCPKDVNVVSSTVEGDKANLKLVVGDGKPVFSENPLVGKTKEETKGEVLMVLEDGEWKIEKEKWKTNSTSADATPAPADAPAATTPTPEASSDATAGKTESK